MPSRLPGWELGLAAAVEAARAKPYRLGEHDCFRLACRVVQALTGADRWPEFRGYRTKAEARALIARHGRSFEEAFDWFFGRGHESARFARRGDICAIQTADGEKHLGVCLGPGGQTALLAEEGLAFVPTLTCLCCWKVG